MIYFNKIIQIILSILILCDVVKCSYKLYIFHGNWNLIFVFLQLWFGLDYILNGMNSDCIHRRTLKNGIWRYKLFLFFCIHHKSYVFEQLLFFKISFDLQFQLIFKFLFTYSWRIYLIIFIHILKFYLLFLLLQIICNFI